MKRSSFLLLLAVSLTSVNTFSQKEPVTKITAVTVYRTGAVVTRESTGQLSKGTATLIFRGLTAKLDPSTIQFSTTGEVVINSVTHSIDYLNKAEADKEVKALQQKQKLLTDSIRVTLSLKKVYDTERNMIMSNSSIGGNNGVDITELKQTATFFRERLTEIEKLSHNLDLVTGNLRNELYAVSRQLLELNAKTELPTSTVRVIVSADKPVTTEMKLSYFVADAFWEPAYDIRIKETNQPLELFYKARVSQSTDEEWKDVKMTLNTGNPSLDNRKPEMSAYFLTFDNYYRNSTPAERQNVTPLRGRVSGVVTDAETGDPLPGVNIVITGTTTGTITDVNGRYSLDVPEGRVNLTVSFIGCQTQQVVADKAVMNFVMSPDVMALEEVVVTAYGVSDDSYSPSYSRSYTPPVRKKVQVPMAIEKRELATEFRIENPYTIPSDNQPYDVNMVSYEIDADYQYYAVPKLSGDAYLIARIPDWVNYNLQAGPSFIFLKGVYQGESFIDPVTSEDTLSLSIGRDKDIVVTREQKKDFSSRSITGTTKREQKAWTITIKNNKGIPVMIDVEDQFPVSKDDNIKVDVDERSGAERDASTGKLLWKLELAPMEKRTVEFVYTVRYPSDRRLIVD